MFLAENSNVTDASISLLCLCLSSLFFLPLLISHHPSSCICVPLCVCLSVSFVLACVPVVKTKERDLLKTLRLVSAAEACAVEQHGRAQEDEDKGVGHMTSSPGLTPLTKSVHSSPTA